MKYKKTPDTAKIAEKKYPSRFGSHRGMVVSTSEYSAFYESCGWVVCEDARGRYITRRDKLDNGLMDTNRIPNATYRKTHLDEVLATVAHEHELNKTYNQETN